MPGFGFKIVERCRAEIGPLVKLALQEQRPIEVGLYFGDAAALELLSEQLPRCGVSIAAHLDHRRFSIFDIQTRERALREQLRIAAEIGADYVITHLSPHPMTARLAFRQAMWDRLFADIRFIRNLCGEYGLDLHIENSYQDLAFYHHLFEGVVANDITGVRSCFDLGHAKVWSNDCLASWLLLLSKLTEHGLRLHFHLHANHGLSDEHLSFTRAERLGLTMPDSFTGSMGYYEATAEINGRFPTATKVFEVPPHEAIENLTHVADRIAAVRERRLARETPADGIDRYHLSLILAKTPQTESRSNRGANHEQTGAAAASLGRDRR